MRYPTRPKHREVIPSHKNHHSSNLSGGIPLNQWKNFHHLQEDKKHTLKSYSLLDFYEDDDTIYGMLASHELWPNCKTKKTHKIWGIPLVKVVKKNLGKDSKGKEIVRTLALGKILDLNTGEYSPLFSYNTYNTEIEPLSGGERITPKGSPSSGGNMGRGGSVSIFLNSFAVNNGRGINPPQLLPKKGSKKAFWILHLTYTAYCEKKENPKLESIEVWPAFRNYDGSIDTIGTTVEGVPGQPIGNATGSSASPSVIPTSSILDIYNRE
jgi:hypothetical protein